MRQEAKESSLCFPVEWVEFNRHIYRKLTAKDIEWIISHCDKKLDEYYEKRNF